MKLDLIISEHTLCTVFGREITIYGVLYLCGIFLAALCAMRCAVRRGVDRWEVVYSGVFAVIGGLIGAKVLSWLTTLPIIIPYLQNGGSFFEVIRSGFVFYGGLLGGAGGLYLYTRIYKYSYFDYADLFAPGVAIGHALGRIGCLFGGCCYGKEVDAAFPLTVRYAYGDPAYAVGVRAGRYYLPTQLLEALALILIFFAAMAVFRRGRRGEATVVYALSYPVVRFVLEFFRADEDRGYLGPLSTSQWISIAIFLCGIVGSVLLQRRKSRPETKEAPDEKEMN